MLETYNPEWPNQYNDEVVRLIEIFPTAEFHHVGSTSVPNLTAKPIIDILMISDAPQHDIKEKLEANGYEYCGELNIPFKHFLQKNAPFKVHLHVFPKDHPEINLNILFRDKLRASKELFDQYKEYKLKLATEPDAFIKKPGKRFMDYTLLKNNCIIDMLEKAGLTGEFVRFASHEKEWDSIDRITKLQLENHGKIYTSDLPKGENHFYFTLSAPFDIVSCAHLEKSKIGGVLHFLATDEPYKGRGYAGNLLQKILMWCEIHGLKHLTIIVPRNEEPFYTKHGFKKTKDSDVSDLVEFTFYPDSLKQN
jgi:GrpB-like predicted nucleotidyltransferase (UPF0157 family)/GNAT superfamily N-acetyltransferase